MTDWQTSISTAWGGLNFDFDQNRISVAGQAGDRLQGSAADDHVWGRGGNDQIAGGSGDDVLYGQGGNDLLTGGFGADRLVGGDGADRLYGGVEADGLMGGDGDDFLDEGAGHGDLDGGKGDDILVGGQGPDAFAVSRDSGNDVIRDFTAGPGMFDHLALRGLQWEDLSFTDTTGGVRVEWNGGSVLLEGVAKADLAQDDFMFADRPDLPPGSAAPSGPTAEATSISGDGPVVGSPTLGFVQASFDVLADAALARAESIQDGP